MTSADCQVATEAKISGGTDAERGHQHLRGAQTEDGLAHDPEPGGLQLQSDHEHEQHDAELGNVLGGVDVVDKAQARGPDDDAGGQIAQAPSLI